MAPNPKSVESTVDDLDEYLEEQAEDRAFQGALRDADRRAEIIRGLLDARRESQFTQEEVAARMGTTQSAISELEGGVGDPRFSTLQRFARAVGCELVAHVRRIGTDQRDEDSIDGAVRRQIDDLIGQSVIVTGHSVDFRSFIEGWGAVYELDARRPQEPTSDQAEPTSRVAI